MSCFIFRNSTIEPLFSDFVANFSGYDDILNIDHNAEFYIWFFTLPHKADQDKVCALINSFKNSLEYVLSQISENKAIFALTLASGPIVVFESGINQVKNAVADYNKYLYDQAKKFPNLKIIDFENFSSKYALKEIIDWKYYYLSMMPVNPKLAKAFRVWFRKQLDAIELKRKKCLVLDLDNTLWGGVLGEDGISGIKIGATYPGNAFSDFQTSLLELSQKGILLAVCSKNNKDDVLEAWEKSTYMILKKDNFSSLRINWENKAKNIQEIAEELNIGLDSMVFVDDSPTERELIKTVLPMVEVPDFPNHPYELKTYFAELVEKYFMVYQLTHEDISKAQQYQGNAQRAELQNTYINFEEYLRNLEIEITISKANEYNILRIAQMTQKTNQFNLTTRRYTDTDIRKFIDNGNWVYCVSVKDKFGDQGITGLIIINLVSETAAAIDTFLLSCRILGKNIEEQFLSNVIDKLFRSGINEVNAIYIPTHKNEQVNNFYEKNGFQLISTAANGMKTYKLMKESFNFVPSKIYKIKSHD